MRLEGFTGTVGVWCVYIHLMCLSMTAALRFCRRIVGLKDEFYNRYIVRDNLLAPIVKAFMANGRRYNLLNSAIIELFEYLRMVSERCMHSHLHATCISVLQL